jgi:hypothetical protein
MVGLNREYLPMRTLLVIAKFRNLFGFPGCADVHLLHFYTQFLEARSFFKLQFTTSDFLKLAELFPSCLWYPWPFCLSHRRNRLNDEKRVGPARELETNCTGPQGLSGGNSSDWLPKFTTGVGKLAARERHPLRAARNCRGEVLATPCWKHLSQISVLDSSSSRAVKKSFVWATWTFCLCFKISFHLKRVLYFYSSDSLLEVKCVLND